MIYFGVKYTEISEIKELNIGDIVLCRSHKHNSFTLGKVIDLFVDNIITTRIGNFRGNDSIQIKPTYDDGILLNHNEFPDRMYFWHICKNPDSFCGISTIYKLTK